MTIAVKDLYGLDPQFERAVITMLCDQPKLFRAIGGEVDPERLGLEPAKLALRAARAILQETGLGPGTSIIVLQRLRRWLDEGRVTKEEIDGVLDMFDDADEEGLPTVEEVIAELSPILKRHLQNEAMQKGIETLARQGDMSPVAQALEKAERLGAYSETVGTELGATAVADIKAAQLLVRLPTGIPELDIALDGGSEQGSLFIIAGTTGAGKSIFLVQTAVNAFLEGKCVVYATLELSRARTAARAFANLSGTPINAILAGQHDRLNSVLDQVTGRGGALAFEYFSPGAQIGDMTEWVKRVEARKKRRVDVVIIDYADKMTAAKKRDKKSTGSNSYEEMGDVFEGLRVWMEETQRWGWTASQPQRLKHAKRIGTEDLADSQNKARSTDGLVTITASEDKRHVDFFIAKNRNGTSDIAVGPLPTDWACARIAPVNRWYERRSAATPDDRQTSMHLRLVQ